MTRNEQDRPLAERRSRERQGQIKADNAARRCSYCDGTGDVHSHDGEWRGHCSSCPAWQYTASQSSTGFFHSGDPT